MYSGNAYKEEIFCRLDKPQQFVKKRIKTILTCLFTRSKSLKCTLKAVQKDKKDGIVLKSV